MSYDISLDVDVIIYFHRNVLFEFGYAYLNHQNYSDGKAITNF